VNAGSFSNSASVVTTTERDGSRCGDESSRHHYEHGYELVRAWGSDWSRNRPPHPSRMDRRRPAPRRFAGYTVGGVRHGLDLPFTIFASPLTVSTTTPQPFSATDGSTVLVYRLPPPAYAVPGQLNGLSGNLLAIVLVSQSERLARGCSSMEPNYEVMNQQAGRGRVPEPHGASRDLGRNAVGWPFRLRPPPADRGQWRFSGVALAVGSTNSLVVLQSNVCGLVPERAARRIDSKRLARHPSAASF